MKTDQLNISFESLLTVPWVIQPGILSNVIRNILKKAEKDGTLILDYRNKIEYEVINNKAVIEINGLFYNKLIIDDYFGFVLCNLENTLLSAVDDTNVDEIILKITSPGGVSYGVSEIYNLINTLKEIKPINAYVNGCACSALYWIPSACTGIYAYTQSDIGSIGVYALHADYSKLFEEFGIKVQFIKAGKYKTAGNMYEPLDKEMKEYIQKSVDQTYKDFYTSVAESRNLKIEDKEKWAEGQAFETKKALKLGLIDGIKTWQEMLGYDKNNFSLKIGRSVMAIGEKKISELTAVELKEKNSQLYTSIYDAGREEGLTLGKKTNETTIDALNEKVSSLEGKVEAYEKLAQKQANEEKIRKFAKKLNLADEGEKLIKENKTVVEAFDILAEKAEQAKADEQNNFLDSAASTAGLGSDNISDDAPKNSVEAVAYCKKKYNLSNNRAAWRKARVEFASLFGNEKIED